MPIGSRGIIPPASAQQLASVVTLLPSASVAYRKRVLANLAGFGNDTATIIATYGYTYIYPEAMTFDYRTGELFVLKSSVGGSNAWNWIEVWDWATKTFKVTFSAGTNTSEGIEIVYNGAQRLMWIRSDTTGSLAAYDITTLPSSLARLTSVQEQVVDLNLDFSFNQEAGVAMVEIRSQPIGNGSLIQTPRNAFATYSLADWTRLGNVTFDVLDCGLSTTTGDNPESDQVPKRQGTALGAGYYVSVQGAFYQHDTAGGSLPIQYCGPKTFGPTARKTADGLLEPQAFINLLASQAGITAFRTEYEAVVIAPSGQTLFAPGTIISLMMIRGASDTGGTTQGMVFFEEFSKDVAAIDYSTAARYYPAMDLDMLMLQGPQQGNAQYNPLTGAKFTSINRVLDFMTHMSLPRWRLYTSTVTNLVSGDLNGNAFPTGTEIRLENRNNTTIWMELSFLGRNKEYQISWTPGVGYNIGSGSQGPARYSRRPYTSGRVYPGAGHTGMTSGPTNPGTAKIVLYPGNIRSRVRISNLGARVKTLAAGGNAQFGMYFPISDTNPLPGLFLCRTASISVAATGAISSATVAADGSAFTTSPLSDPDDMWFAVMVDNTTVLFEGYAGADLGVLELVGAASFAEAISGTATALGGYSTPATFGTWPADLTSATLTALGGLLTPTVLFQAA